MNISVKETSDTANKTVQTEQADRICWVHMSSGVATKEQLQQPSQAKLMTASIRNTSVGEVMYQRRRFGVLQANTTAW